MSISPQCGNAASLQTTKISLQGPAPKNLNFHPTRTVTDPVCAFGSRQGRSGGNRRRGFLRNEPNFPGETEAVALSALEFPCITFIENGRTLRTLVEVRS